MQKVSSTKKLLGGSIPVVFFLVAILLIMSVPSKLAYNSQLLSTILTLAFVGASYILVAYITAGAYLRTGSLSFILVGSSLILGGFTSVLAFTFSNSPNYEVTVFNLGVFGCAILNFVSALSVFFGLGSPSSQKKHSVGLPLATYSIFTVLSFVIAFLALKNLTPVFFMQGVGATLIRKLVVGASIGLFGISSLLFLKMYSEDHSDILFWYAGALALLAVSLFTIFFVKVVGGELSWLGRIAQYLSGIYFLLAVLSSATPKKTAERRPLVQESEQRFT